jgi:hypothetical protein
MSDYTLRVARGNDRLLIWILIATVFSATIHLVLREMSNTKVPFNERAN